MKIYGVSTPRLQDYLTSERDWIRKIDRKPNDDYVVDVLGLGKKALLAEDDLDMEAAVDEFFDFVIIDKDDIMKEEKDNKVRI